MLASDTELYFKDTAEMKLKENALLWENKNMEFINPKLFTIAIRLSAQNVCDHLEQCCLRYNLFSAVAMLGLPISRNGTHMQIKSQMIL